MADNDWRAQLQPASFRGVAFYYLETDGQIGRRNVVHEYPLRDVPYCEDLGRKAREFTIDAFVLGADYMSARDDLIKAIETAGPGELVHPYRGQQQVVVTNASLRETSAEGGMARFNLTFVEAGQPQNPAPQTDTKAAVVSAADAAQAASESSFSDLFSVAGLQDFVSNGALATVGSALNSLRLSANGLLSNGLLPEVLLSLTGMSNNLASLIRTPLNLAQGLFGQTSVLSSLAKQPLAALNAYRSLFGFGSSLPAVAATTPSRSQQAQNQTAVVQLMRQAAVISAAKASTQVTPASYTEAVTLRDELANQLETLAETAPDPVYHALTVLRLAVINDLTARAANLERTVQWPVPKTLPVLVIAHRLYGQLQQADALVARNRIRHPGFVPGGQNLEVLTP